MIWFFYEGNDYEDNIQNYEAYNNYKGHISNSTVDVSNSTVDEINYLIKRKFEISLIYKFKVWLAEKVNGISSLAKYFKNYEKLLDEKSYDKALKISEDYLSQKNIKNRYIYYIPSWQRLANYKSIKYRLYENNPQIKQLNYLKKSVMDISKKNGFIFIDGEEIFINQPDPLKVFHYRLNTHFNRLGYKMLANDVYNKIVKKLY